MVQGLEGFRAQQRLGLRAQDLGFSVQQGSGFMVQGLEFRVQDLGLVQLGLGLVGFRNSRVYGLGFRVQGLVGFLGLGLLVRFLSCGSGKLSECIQCTHFRKRVQELNVFRELTLTDLELPRVKLEDGLARKHACHEAGIYSLGLDKEEGLWYSVQGLGCMAQGLAYVYAQAVGFRLQALGFFRLQAVGYRLQALGFRLQVLGFRLQALGFRLQALGCRLQAVGFRLQD